MKHEYVHPMLREKSIVCAPFNRQTEIFKGYEMVEKKLLRQVN